MSLRDTRDIGTAKIVMLGGGGGGGSYTAGSGISISNSVITNIRKGALTGVVDSISDNIAHTQITGARDTFAAGALILLQSEAAGTANNLRIQYGAQSSESQTFAIYDTSSTAASITIASGDTVIMMIDNTGYRAIILNVLSASGGSSYAGLGIGKKKTVTSNVIDTDIDLHRAPIVGDRLLVWFDEKVTNPTGLTTYNNGTAVTSNLESVTPLYYNAGWNILEFKNDGFLYNNCWVRQQNVPIPNNTLVGLSDTAIVSPSDGQLLMYDNETQKWKNKTYVEANTGFPVTELKKLKVGNVVYDTDGMKNYFVTDVANDNITISVLNPEQFVQEVIAINTGAHSGSSSAWNLYLNGGMIPVSVALKNADGTAFSDDISANELLFVAIDLTNYEGTVLSIAGASGGATTLSALTDTAITTPTDGQVLTYNSVTGKWKNQNPSGGGTTITKTRYTITSSSWSASANADGYYTYSVSLSPTLYTAVAPNVYIAGSTDSTAPTDTEKSMFAYVDRCRLAGYSSLTLYAKTKPTSTFYIYVEGVNGLGSGNIEGNVIQPNGASGGNYSTTETLTGETWIDGRPIYRKVLHFGALPAANVEKAISTGISYTSIRVLKCDFTAWDSVGSLQITVPIYVSTSNTANVFNGMFTINMQSSNNLQFRLQSTIDLTSYTDSYVIIEYIKL